MNDEALTPTRILEAAEDVLRRFGPAKATVVDVARALGVSYGSVYRHFPSKVALRDVEDLTGQLARIIADGVTRGELAAADPAIAGRAVFDATARFHNPTHALEWSDPSIDAAFAGVKSLVLRGLGAQTAERRS